MRLLARLGLVGALCAIAGAQPAHRAEFEVASVKLSPPGEAFTIADGGGPNSPTPGSWFCQYCTLMDLLTKAYGMHQSQISGPAWMKGQRFHVRAKLPPESARGQFCEMLRNLLIERFALAAHIESRTAFQYELALGRKAHKLRPSSERRPDTGKARRPPGILDADGFPVLGPPSDEPEILTIAGRTRMFFPRMTMNDLADELTQKLGRRVIDATGITGEFDIGLYWSEDDAGPSLKQALQDQLGLRLVEKIGPLDFVVVDHIEKLPSAN